MINVVIREHSYLNVLIARVLWQVFQVPETPGSDIWLKVPQEYTQDRHIMIEHCMSEVTTFYAYGAWCSSVGNEVDLLKYMLPKLNSVTYVYLLK